MIVIRRVQVVQFRVRIVRHVQRDIIMLETLLVAKKHVDQLTIVIHQQQHILVWYNQILITDNLPYQYWS